jgi:hypothetical protein
MYRVAKRHKNLRLSLKNQLHCSLAPVFSQKSRSSKPSPTPSWACFFPRRPLRDGAKLLGKAKSDWLYEQVVEAGLFRNLLSKLDLASPPIPRKFEEAQDHDERAALICLLTAMFARSGDVIIVGDTGGGWFWLPPMTSCAPWASAALVKALGPSPKNRFPLTRHWKRDVLMVKAP